MLAILTCEGPSTSSSYVLLPSAHNCTAYIYYISSSFIYTSTILIPIPFLIIIIYEAYRQCNRPQRLKHSVRHRLGFLLLRARRAIPAYTRNGHDASAQFIARCLSSRGIVYFTLYCYYYVKYLDRDNLADCHVEDGWMSTMIVHGWGRIGMFIGYCGLCGLLGRVSHDDN